jgi:transcriptional regulator with XRE-family HTH domain
MSLFSKNLRFLRKQRHLNQEVIARLFSKRSNTIGNWENGKSEPSLSELVKLGDYFNIGLHELLHTDLESEKIPATPTTTSSPEKKPAVYILDEPVGNIANDEGGYSIGSVLRELGTIHEKLDKISLALGTAGNRSPFDKSNH